MHLVQLNWIASQLRKLRLLSISNSLILESIFEKEFICQNDKEEKVRESSKIGPYGNFVNPPSIFIYFLDDDDSYAYIYMLLFYLYVSSKTISLMA